MSIKKSEFIDDKKKLYNTFYENDNHRWNKYDNKTLYNKYNNLLLETLAISINDRMKSFLEIGPGDGRFIKMICNNSEFDTIELNITDFSNKALELCKQKINRNCNFYINDYLKQSQYFIDTNKTFDIIFSCRVFHHFYDVKKCLENTYNLLSDNGIFLLILPNNLNYTITINKEEGLKRLNGGSNQIEWHYSYRTWNNIIKSIGFNSVTFRLPDEQWGFCWILTK